MHLQVEQLINVLDPYRVLKDMGVKPREHEGNLCVECPSCKSKLQIGKTALLCENKSCDFLTGNIIDFLAYIEPHKDYEKVIDYLFKTYETELKAQAFHGTEYLKSQLAEHCTKNRALINYLMKLRGNNQKLSEYNGWFRKMGIVPTLNQNSIIAVSEKELLDLFENYAPYNPFREKIENRKDSSYLLVLYYKNLYTLSYIEIYAENKLIHTLPVHSSKFSFAGLHNGNVNASKVKLYLNPMEAFENYSDSMSFMDADNDSLFLAVKRTQGATKNTENKFKKATYMYSLKDSITDAAHLNHITHDLHVGISEVESKTSQTVNWNTFLFSELQKLLKHHEFKLTPKVESIFKELNMNDIVKSTLNKWLTSINHEKLAQQLTTVNTKPQMVWQSGAEIIKTEKGYIACKPNDLSSTQFTNFTLELENYIDFPDSNDLYYNGYVHMEDKKFPFRLERKSITTPQKIESAAIRGVKMSGIPYTNLPVIIDNAYGKYLTKILMRDAASISKVPGVSKLGWNSDKSVFTLTDGVVDRNDIINVGSFPNPKNRFLESSFIFNKIKINPKVKEFYNKEVLKIVSVIVSHITRSYIGAQVVPLRVKRNKASVNMLKFIFAAFGQKSPVEINTNRKRENAREYFSELGEYPVLGFCSDSDYVDKFNYPLVSLVPEDGLELTSELSLEQYQGVYNFVKNNIPIIIRHIILTEGATYNIHKENSLQMVTLEGLEYMNRVLKKSWKLPDSELSNLFKLLYDTPKSKVKFSFKLDMVNQAIVINTRHSNVVRSDLYPQLVSSGLQPALKNKYDIVVPHSKFYHILTNFYGTDVQLGVIDKIKEETDIEQFSATN